MLNSKSFLAVDFGAGSLKLAEFEVNEAGGLLLRQYSIKPLGPEGAQDTTREATILKALQSTLSEKGIKSKVANVCAPGFHVFSKFVKLPPVDASKVTQIIEYEAKSNVPFPLEEVVWDYQILGTAPSGELEVLLVAIKADVVGGICESGDYFAKDRRLAKVGEGDYLALLSAGAYGFVMASTYNTRSLAAEVLVNGAKAAVIRERQPVSEIWSGEKVAGWLKG